LLLIGGMASPSVKIKDNREMLLLGRTGRNVNQSAALTFSVREIDSVIAWREWRREIPCACETEK
jgi:hypothetical protein